MNYYTFDKPGADGVWKIATEAQRQKLIDIGKRDASQFIPEKDFAGMENLNPQEVFAKAQPVEVDPGSVMRRDLDKKEDLINMLSNVYTGDLQTIVDQVLAGGTAPKRLNQNQKDMYGTVYNIIHAPSIGSAINGLSDSDSRYSKYLGNVISRQQLYTDEQGNPREPTVGETLFPNYSARSENGLGSKAIGAVHDVLTLPSRAVTAGVSEASPYGDHLSLAQQMARPVEASTAPENVLDFTFSGTPVGAATRGAAKLGARVLGKTAPFAEVVRDVSGATKSLPTVIGEGAARGAVEGAAYSLEPAAVLATVPGEESPYSTFGEALGLGAIGGAGLGALGAGGRVAAAKNQGLYAPGELTGYTRELLYPGEATKRLQTAVKREPLQNAAQIEKNYADILDETQREAVKQIQGKREAGLQNISDIQQTPVPTLYLERPGPNLPVPAPRILSREDLAAELTKQPGTPSWTNVRGVIKDALPENYARQIGSDILSDNNKMLYMQETPVDLLDFATKEWDRVRGNLEKVDYSPKEIITETTRLNRLGERTADPSKQRVYKDLASKLRESEAQISDVYLGGQSTTGQSALPEARSDYEQMYRTLEQLPAPEKLISEAKSRVSTGTKSNFAKLMEAEESLNALRNKYQLPAADILTAPVAANVRAMRAPSGVNARDVIDAVNAARTGYLGMAADLGGNIVGGYGRGLTMGGYTPGLMSEEDFTYPTSTQIPFLPAP